MKDLHIPVTEQQFDDLDQFARRVGYVSPEELLRSVVAQMVKAPRDPFDARVVAGVLAHKSDADIAAELNVQNQLVSTHRRKYGLKANRRYGYDGRR